MNDPFNNSPLFVQRKLRAAIAVLLCLVGMGTSVGDEPVSASRDFSGWRGGIGITFGTPSRDIADVTEMGYEIAWGSEDRRAIKALGVSVFVYWNSIVETSLKGTGYDFSKMPDLHDAREKLILCARLLAGQR